MSQFRIFYSQSQQSVLINGSRVFTPGSGALLAYLSPTRSSPADYIDVIYPDLIDQSSQVRTFLFEVLYTDILDENGDQVAGTPTDVVNYLNAQFMEGGNGGSAPIITSQLSAEQIQGEGFNYFITASNQATIYDISTTSTDFVINQTTGQITGSSTSLGITNINITAANQFGSDTETLQVNVIAGGGYTNTKSVRFIRNRQQYVDMGTGAALSFKEDEPFSLSVWTEEARGGIIRRLAADGTGYELFQDAGREIFFRLIADSGAIEGEIANIPNNVWTHLVITYDGSEDIAGVTAYFDGVSQTVTNRDNSLSGTINATANFRLGDDGDEGYSNANFDEVAVYNKELSGAEVTTIYNGGSPDDLTSIGPTANLAGYWRMGDGDTFPTLNDNSANSNDGTMTNMNASSIENNVP